MFAVNIMIFLKFNKKGGDAKKIKYREEEYITGGNYPRKTLVSGKMKRKVCSKPYNRFLF